MFYRVTRGVDPDCRQCPGWGEGIHVIEPDSIVGQPIYSADVVLRKFVDCKPKQKYKIFLYINQEEYKAKHDIVKMEAY